MHAQQNIVILVFFEEFVKSNNLCRTAKYDIKMNMNLDRNVTNPEQDFWTDYDDTTSSLLGRVAATEVYSEYEEFEPCVFDPKSQLFLRAVLQEIEEIEPTGKEILGPYYPDFTDKLKELDQALKAIDPRLDSSALHARGYRPERPRLIGNYWENNALDKLYQRKNSFLTPVAEAHWEEDRPVQIKPGQLDEPPFRQQRRARSCVAACFSMIFEDITGDKLADSDIFNMAKEKFKDPVIEQEKLLKIFDTPSYQSEYGKGVKVIRFTGMDLASIAKIGSRMHEKSADYKVYCVLNLASEAAADPNVWHNGVLLETNEHTVTYHDPSFM